jgi:FkbM family methyltransferase
MIYSNIKIQVIHVIKYLFSKNRFIDYSLPTSNVRSLFDKVSGKKIEIFVRDKDDWTQIEHIFLSQGFNLVKTARLNDITNLFNKINLLDLEPLIIDLGANIGLASKYFDIVFSGSLIIAVEPSPGNCEIAAKNLPPSAILYRAAVSSCGGRANLISTGRNVGFRVQESSDGDVQLVTIQDLLKLNKGTVPFLIKIDIEGHESELFSKNSEWIDLFPVILIELHDWMLPGKCVTSNFLKAISTRNRDFIHFDGYIASIATDLSNFTTLG